MGCRQDPTTPMVEMHRLIPASGHDREKKAGGLKMSLIKMHGTSRPGEARHTCNEVVCSDPRSSSILASLTITFDKNTNSGVFPNSNSNYQIFALDVAFGSNYYTRTPTL